MKRLKKIECRVICEEVLSKELTRSCVNLEINHIKVELDKG